MLKVGIGMRAARTVTVMLVALAVLWASTPVFACILAVPRPCACCGMMQNCPSSMGMKGKSCCTARPQAELLPPIAPLADHDAFSRTATVLRLEITFPKSPRSSAWSVAEVSPPSEPPGAPFALRI